MRLKTYLAIGLSLTGIICFGRQTQAQSYHVELFAANLPSSGLPEQFKTYIQRASNDDSHADSAAAVSAMDDVPRQNTPVSVLQNGLFSPEALVRLQKLAAAGNAEALFTCGMLHYYGLGLSKDLQQSVDCYTRAAELGSVESLSNLGSLYESSDSGALMNLAKAKYYYEKSAQKNCNVAAYDLGAIYLGGHGEPADASKAVYWFKRAAKQNFAPALYQLANCYESGIGGCHSAAARFKLLKRAALASYSPAEFKLGQMYEAGQGTAKDLDAAATWYLKAALNGSGEAIERIRSNDFQQTRMDIQAASPEARHQINQRLAGNRTAND
jgi:TPR repeat protein